MRLLSAALALSLPLTPFIVFMVMTDYSGILIYVFMGITAIIGVIGLVRGRGLGRAGLFSAFSSMALLAFAMGYIPYTTGVALGTVNEPALRWLALSISLSIYAYFLGNVYEASSRIARRMRELGYGAEGLRELDTTNAVVIGVGVLLLGVSFVITLLMEVLRIISLAPVIALLLFIIVYLIAMVIARVHRG
ncbi:hypothetical protein [Vulcanisaeta souniana]|uniref:Uncharacterized protein n=1 Tax=Vulcanisaeta souniana JCM 11219 TaxID=1293586 RepID=A0A830E483_9CREN|nr:hypothetical protein [Vulcanisaeta souniana]BDR91271.1 hypothetical protein Vsou_03640 [Vulcanisaeta souniana JCM 11219]GGI84973.1 hypothetical protein GCM10007112_22430 [Vulcanisaeta souniana JCM 11219]